MSRRRRGKRILQQRPTIDRRLMPLVQAFKSFCSLVEPAVATQSSYELKARFTILIDLSFPVSCFRQFADHACRHL